jgi:hypothetical protein
MPTPDHTKAPFMVPICPSELADHMCENGLKSTRIVEYRRLDFLGRMKTFSKDMANGGGSDDDKLAMTDEDNAESVRKNRPRDSKASKKAMRSMQELTIKVYWVPRNTFRLLGMTAKS